MRKGLLIILAMLVVASVGASSPSGDIGRGTPQHLTDSNLLRQGDGISVSSSSRTRVVIVLKDQPLPATARKVKKSYTPTMSRQVGRLQELNAKMKVSEEEVRRLGVRQARQEELSKLSVRERRELKAAQEDIREMAKTYRKEVLKEQRKKVSSDQRAVKRTVEGCGGEVTGSTAILNSVFATIPSSCLSSLENNEEVLAVYKDQELKTQLNNAVCGTGAPTFYNASFNGTGIRVAVVDTGIDGTHPALDLVAEANFVTQENTTDDLNGHGTHVGGIVASRNDTYRGMAFGAGLIDAKAGNVSGSFLGSEIMEAVDWAINNESADVISLSVGGSVLVNDCSLCRFFDAVVDDLGISTAIAAGNDGPSKNTTNFPGVAYNAFSVAATDDQNTCDPGDDSIASFSSRGSVFGRVKPDIAAPGNSIISANNDWEGNSSDFVSNSGTSMATPMVSGAVSLVLDWAPQFTLNPKAIRALLFNTANTSGTWSNRDAYGWGVLDLEHAFAHKNDVVTENITEGAVKYYEGSLEAGEKATLVWHRHVTYNGSDSPDTWYSLNDLDLHLYDADTGEEVNKSVSGVDNVEQVESNDSRNVVIKVRAFDTNFSHGSDEEEYSLATEENFTSATAHNLSHAQDLPNSTTDGEGFNVSVNVSNTGGLKAHNVTLTVNLPTGFSANSSNTTVISTVDVNQTQNHTFIIDPDILGTYNITTSYQDTSYGEGTSGTTPVRNITVTDDDTDFPTYSNLSSPNQTKTYQNITVTIQANDPSNISSSVITYNISGTVNQTNMTLVNGTWNGTIPAPGNTARNTNITFHVTVTDGDLDRNNDSLQNQTPTQSIFVQNEAPNITGSTPANNTLAESENSSVFFNHTSSDLDGNTLTYSWKLDGAEQSNQTSWNYTINFTQAGNHTIKLVVSDGLANDTETWNISVSNVNRKPAWNTTPADQIISEDSTLNYSIPASDPGGESITYSVNDTDFNYTNGVLLWTPPQDFYGLKELTLQISDGIENVTANITINVTPVNDPPTLQTISNVTVNESENVTITLNASDVENDTLTYSVNSSKFNQSNQTFNWQTNTSDSGTYTFRFSVNDSQNVTAQDVVVTVIDKQDLDGDGIPDYKDDDDDNDGLNDTEDTLLGNETSINTSSLGGVQVRVNGSTNLTQRFNKTLKVRITDSGGTEVEFNHDFNTTLVLYNLSIEKRSSGRGGISVSGLSLGTKNVSIENLLTATGICIRDQEGASLSDFTSDCSDSSETWVECDGSSDGYTCTYNSSSDTYKVSGLSNTAVQQQPTFCGDGVQNGGETCSTCPTDAGACETTTTQGGGGGGGAGSAFFFGDDNETENATNETSEDLNLTAETADESAEDEKPNSTIKTDLSGGSENIGGAAAKQPQVKEPEQPREVGVGSTLVWVAAALTIALALAMGYFIIREEIDDSEIF